MDTSSQTAGGQQEVSGQSFISTLSLLDQFASCCTVAAVLISGYQILMHLRHFHESQIQLQIIRILLIIPVYSIATWLSIMIPSETLMFSTIRDIYEAYVLYVFMQLLVHFLGGENSLIVHLEFKRRIKQPWPFDRQKPIQTDKLFYHRVKQGVLQFVIIKPITAILAIVLDKYDLYNEGDISLQSAYFYLAGINNCSVSLSLYCLVLFYKATEERLAPFSPFYKFLCVKAILFFSFWQTCLFQLLDYFEIFSTRETGNIILNLITCAEMVLAAIAQSFAFTYKDFINNRKAKGDVMQTLGKILFAKDVLDDAHRSFIQDFETDKEEETQMDELLKEQRAAFNWSDEEMVNELDQKTKQNMTIKKKYNDTPNYNTMTSQKKKTTTTVSASPPSKMQWPANPLASIKKGTLSTSYQSNSSTQQTSNRSVQSSNSSKDKTDDKDERSSDSEADFCNIEVAQ